MTFRGTGRFQLVEQLGAGSFGVVYSAIDRQRGDRVALKTLRHLDANALYRFKKEFRALADVAHPNLVSLYELGSEGDAWFFTMELVPGVDLLTFLRRRPAGEVPTVDLPADGPVDELTADAPSPQRPPAPPVLDEALLRATFRQLADGVNALHAAGKLHRDIKPSNILVTESGRVVLLDFGLVKELDKHSGEQRVLGTAAYMAPEQALTEASATPAADWYSVGVILYEALTGRLPHEGQLVELMMAKQAVRPVPPAELEPDAPAELSALCMELLAAAPGGRPTGPQVLARLDPGSSVPAASQATPFVGRDPELTRLRGDFEACRGGQAVVVHVTGPSGVGKTALVRRFVDELARDEEGVVCLAGRCFPRESVPYNALDTLMDTLSRRLRKLRRRALEAVLPPDVEALARLFPVLQGVTGKPAPTELDPLEERLRGFGALRELLRRMAGERPLVLVLDDLQWGDNDSAALLRELLRPPDTPPLLLLACYSAEDTQRSACLRVLPPADETRRLEVGPLPEEATLILARQLLGEPTDARLVGAITRAAEGNPFFVTEVVRHLRDAGGSLEGEVTLEQVYAERVGRLTEPARRLLAAVAMAGQPVDEALAAEAAGLGAESRAALAELRAGHLVRRGASGEAAVECYHERLRQVVVETIDAGARRTWHQQLVRALAASGADDLELLLVHLEGAGERERAAASAARAAKRAAGALAFERAATLYDRALALHAGAQRELHAEQGQALANAGRGHEAARAFLRAAADARDQQARRGQRRALEQLLINGHIDEGMALLERLGRTFGIELPSAPRRVLAALIWARARLRLRGLSFTRRALEQIPPDDLQRLDLAMAVTRGLGNVVPIQMALLQSHCVRMALDIGEPARVALALGGEVIFSACRGSHTRRRTGHLLRRLHDVGRGLDDRQLEGFVTLVDGMASLLAEGRFEAGLRRLDAAAAILRSAPSHSRYLGRARDRLRLDMAQLYGVECLRRLGRLGELCERVPPLLHDAEQRGNLLLRATLRTGAGHMRWLAEDRPDALREAVDEAMASWSQRGFHLQHMWELWTRCRVDLYRGDEAAALQRLEARWPSIRRSTLLRTQLVLLDLLDLRGKLHLAAAARAPAGQRPRLLQVAEQMARAIEREGVAHGWPLARLLTAGVAAVRGDAAGAVAGLRDARRGFEAARMELLSAAAATRLGALVGGDEGWALAGEASAHMEAQRVVSPERMVALLAPGF